MRRLFILLVLSIFTICEKLNIVADSDLRKSFQSVKVSNFDGHWENIHAASCSDNSPMVTSKVFALSSSEMLRITNFRFDIPENSRILSINAHFDVKVLGFIPLHGFQESLVQLITKDGQVFSTPVRNETWKRELQRISFPLEGEDGLWGYEQWDVSYINSPDFGIAIRVKCGNTDTTGAIRCISLSVTYERENIQNGGTGTETNTNTKTTIDAATSISTSVSTTTTTVIATITKTMTITQTLESVPTSDEPILVEDPEKSKFEKYGSVILTSIGISACAYLSCMIIILFVRNRNPDLRKPIVGKRVQFDFSDTPRTRMKTFKSNENLDDEIGEVITMYSVIGKGSSGTVWKGKKGDLDVACKCSNSMNNSRKIFEELNILRKVNHRNIVKFCGTYYGPIGNDFLHQIFIITEYAENGCLKYFLQTKGGGIEDAVLINMCTDIAKGMCYLSRKGFVHRDLAARNMLVTKDLSIRISGFGKCKKMEKDENQFRDTPQEPLLVSENVMSHPVKWMAPETITNSKYTVKTDIWSFAITMYEIWCKGDDPWPTLSAHQTEDLIIRGATLQLPSRCSSMLQLLITTIMDHESSKRPTFFQILMILNQIKNKDFPNTAENWDVLEEYDYKYQIE